MFLKVVKVEGNSMFPYLKNGQFVIIRKTKKIKVGDVICFHDPENEGNLLIKRVQASSEDHYFVIGDNLPNSRDSRHFGMIPSETIIGKLLFKV